MSTDMKGCLVAWLAFFWWIWIFETIGAFIWGIMIIDEGDVAAGDAVIGASVIILLLLFLLRRWLNRQF